MSPKRGQLTAKYVTKPAGPYLFIFSMLNPDKKLDYYFALMGVISLVFLLKEVMEEEGL